MILADYFTASEATAIYNKSGGPETFYYPFLGLAGEVGELVEKLYTSTDFLQVAKECGDVMWYVAAICRSTGITPDRLEKYNGTRTTIMWGIQISTGMVCEMAKKALRDNGGKIKNLDALAEEMAYITKFVAERANLQGYTFERILDINMEKLLSRKDRGKLQGSGDNR